MTYNQAIKYLESFINYEKLVNFSYKESFKIERIKEVLKTIGNPQDALPCIHIAGTKGKGSTCAFVAYILREAGFRTGLYTSPHLSDFRERIRVLDKEQSAFAEELSPSASADARRSFQRRRAEFEGMISEDELVALVEKLKPSIEKFCKDSKYSRFSFFEVYTAVAFQYFKEKKIDFAVLETGLGGRLDATNVVNPLVCAITPISFEHTHLLGSTLAEIASEKAGIIKNQSFDKLGMTLKQSRRGQIVISAPQEKEADEVIQKRCDEYQAKLYRVGKDLRFKELKVNQTGQTFSVRGLFGDHNDLKINLLGRHQLINATTAIGIIEALRNFNINISEDTIRNGLAKAIWPGRFEIIRKNPYIVLDGAQNVASANALVEIFNRTFDSKKKILVLGISKDKDIKGMCRILSDVAGTIILTKADTPRAAEPNDLKDFIKKDKIIKITSGVKEAMGVAMQSSNKDDVILVTGSLFVVGEARELYLI